MEGPGAAGRLRGSGGSSRPTREADITLVRSSTTVHGLWKPYKVASLQVFDVEQENRRINLAVDKMRDWRLESNTFCYAKNSCRRYTLQEFIMHVYGDKNTTQLENCGPREIDPNQFLFVSGEWGAYERILYLCVRHKCGWHDCGKSKNG